MTDTDPPRPNTRISRHESYTIWLVAFHTKASDLIKLLESLPCDMKITSAEHVGHQIKISCKPIANSSVTDKPTD